MKRSKKEIEKGKYGDKGVEAEVVYVYPIFYQNLIVTVDEIKTRKKLRSSSAALNNTKIEQLLNVLFDLRHERIRNTIRSLPNMYIRRKIDRMFDTSNC